MLTQYKKFEQEKSNQDTKWYSDSDMDLTVWFKNKEIERFQLRYLNGEEDSAVTWSEGEGLLINHVDSGTEDPRYNRSPVLNSPLSISKVKKIKEEFCKKNDHVEHAIVTFILSKLDLK